MTPLMFVPALIAVCAGVVGLVVYRQLRPHVAAWLLTVTMVSAALSIGFALLIAVTASLMQIPWLSSTIGWCGALLEAHHRVPAIVGVTSAGMLILAAVRVARWDRRRRRARRELEISAEPIEILPTHARAAFAVPGRPGHIVVSQGMLDVLEPRQQVALLAHEQAHLDHRHHRYVFLAEVAARAVPVLHPLRRRVRFCTERWADEIAAEETGDRRAVATAIAQAALPGSLSPAGALELSGEGVAARVNELLYPTERGTATVAGATGAVACSTAISLIAAAVQLHHLLAFAVHVCQH